MAVLVPLQSPQALIQFVLRTDEGGYVLSHDPDGGDGGATYAGITRSTWQGAGHVWPPRAPDVPAFYYREFWLPLRVDRVAQPVQLAYLSCGINVGVSGGIKTLQIACGLDDDAAFGPLTEAAAAAADLGRFCDAWQLRYAKIVRANPQKAEYLPGWTRRVNRYRPRP